MGGKPRECYLESQERIEVVHSFTCCSATGLVTFSVQLPLSPSGSNGTLLLKDAIFYYDTYLLKLLL